MTKREAENYAHLSRTVLDRLGVSRDDFDALLRIERALHRWAERECNGEIDYDESGACFVRVHHGDGTCTSGVRTANREAGALKRLATIMARYPKLAAYHQSDPRGCALYIYERARLKEYMDRQSERSGGHLASTPDRAIDCCYSSVGVALCY